MELPLLHRGPRSFPRGRGDITSLLFQLRISFSFLPTCAKSYNGLNLVEMNFSLILREGPKSAVMGWGGSCTSASGSKLLGSRSASALCFSTSSLPQGPGSLQEFQPSDPHSKEEARTKERQKGSKAAAFLLLRFSEILLLPKSCLRLTGQKLVQRPYLGAAELGTGTLSWAHCCSV